jgi:inorganic phosphate transporter, PiT family
MTSALFLLLVVLLVVLAFEYINGFHDTANAIATVVSTKVLTPRQALLLASITNLIGALTGQAVAKTIHSGILDDKVVTVSTLVVFCAMLGGIVWNLVTWWFGMPSSSTHALVGGLIGCRWRECFCAHLVSRETGQSNEAAHGGDGGHLPQGGYSHD